MKMGLKIYYADDDQDDIDLFMSAMDEFGVRATAFLAGDKMMKHLSDSTELPNLIFLDLNMPRKHGFEVLAELRQDDRLKDIPVIVYTTSARPEIIEKARELGARYFIKKGNSFKDITLSLRTAVTYDWTSNLDDRTGFVYRNDPIE